MMTEPYPTKACKKCFEVKTLGCFYKNKASTDGYVGVCIKCKVARRELSRRSTPSQNSLLLQQWADNTRRAL